MAVAPFVEQTDVHKITVGRRQRRPEHPGGLKHGRDCLRCPCLRLAGSSMRLLGGRRRCQIAVARFVEQTDVPDYYTHLTLPTTDHA